MVWSEHWRGLTRSTEQSASTPAVPLRFGKNVRRKVDRGAIAAGTPAVGRLAPPKPPPARRNARLRAPPPHAPPAPRNPRLPPPPPPLGGTGGEPPALRACPSRR